VSDQTNVSGIENLVEIGELRFAAAPNVTNDFSSERKLDPKAVTGERPQRCTGAEEGQRPFF